MNSVSTTVPNKIANSAMNEHQQNNPLHEYNDENARILKRGYFKIEYMTKTLQGDIHLANDTRNKSIKRPVVIKRTAKDLHNKGITIQNTVKYEVSEDVIREAHILKKLNQDPSHPKSLIAFIDFFQTDHNYYLVMESGGNSFFTFIKTSHESINKGLISIKHWRKQCKIMFAQMVQFMKWMHSKGFCNLDISMENMLIAHDCHYDAKKKELRNCNIKFIDFGLSEYFPPKSNFECNKFAGKTFYQSPKVFAGQTFDARQADIWSMGVLLYAMLMGLFPYNEPTKNDKLFVLIKDSKFRELVNSTYRMHYLSEDSFDLIQKLLAVDVQKRLKMNEICNHAWLCKYFIRDRFMSYMTSIKHQ